MTDKTTAKDKGSMTFITAERIRQLCPGASPTVAAQIAPALDIGLANAGITNLLRRAHFMGQMAHESGGFARLVENLNYSAPRICQIWQRLCPRAQELAHNPEKLGNAAYANKIGNGNEASGDGFRFRGRGIVQLTGRGNYRAIGARVGLALEDNPELAEMPNNAALIALDFWAQGSYAGRDCNTYADLDDVRSVTRAINGGETGLSDRVALTNRAKGIFI